MSWKKLAENLFFVDHETIVNIASIVRKARETVSRHLNTCESYDDEMKFRRKHSAECRKEYQRQWDRDNRADRYSVINGHSLKREHETAARILSAEKY